MGGVYGCDGSSEPLVAALFKRLVIRFYQAVCDG